MVDQYCGEKLFWKKVNYNIVCVTVNDLWRTQCAVIGSRADELFAAGMGVDRNHIEENLYLEKPFFPY